MLDNTLKLIEDAGLVATHPLQSPSSGLGSRATVEDVLEASQLGLTLAAGLTGLGRPVAGAHVVDRANPWDWLDADELVLTSGAIVPHDAEAQVAFVRRMAETQLSGLVVTLGPDSPTLAPQMLRAAEQLGLPVLRASPETSWAEVTRFVARCNGSLEGQSLRTIMRIHESVRVGLVSPRASADVIAELGSLIGGDLWVVDPATWEPLIPGEKAPPTAWRDALNDALAARGGAMPPVLRLDSSDGELLATPVPIDRSVFLFVQPNGRNTPRITVLKHIAAVCALEIARADAMFDKEWRTGSALLADVLNGTVGADTFGARVKSFDFTLPCLCVALDYKAPVLDRLDRFWAVRRVPHIMTKVGRTAMIMLDAREERLEELRQECRSAGVGAGVSEAFEGFSAIRDASRQARWALESVPARAGSVTEYGATATGFLPRTLTECQQKSDQILGAIIRYDLENDTQLVATLRTYLQLDRSPKRAAEALYVHNQTINYRLARIQELTNRSLRSTADLCDFWLALKALALVQADLAQEATQSNDIRGDVAFE